MNKFNSTLILALGVFVSSAIVQAQAQTPASPAKGDPAAGRQKAVAICSGCHGIPGTKTAFPEVYSVPKIGNQNEAYIVAALRGYRSGERYNSTMKALASSLTEKEILDIAAYYAQSGAQSGALGK
ncbi:MAG: c-type cytochrome [Burkholderiales bacterium]|jgi:cytochrome c553|nr:cytochrome c [Betaproteobacteria bacterium]